MAGLRRQRRVDRDDVGLRQQRIEVGVAAGEDGARTERLDEPRRLATDPPGPDDQYRLAREALAEHELERELPRVAPADEAVALGHPPQQRQHQRQRDLGGGSGQHVRRVRDHDPAPAGRLEVDVVHPDGVVGDDPELRAGRLEIRVVDHDVEHRDDPVGADRRGDELEVGLELPLDLGEDAVREVDAGSHRAHHL